MRSLHRGTEQRRRLQERFLRVGLDGLEDSEALELLLGLVIPRGNVRRPAAALLRRFGDLRGILDAPAEELLAIRGLGRGTPLALQVVRAAASLYLRRRPEGRDVLENPTELETLWRMRIGALRHEVFEVAFLDAGRRLLRNGIERLQEGTVDRAAVYPRRVVESALRRGAAAIVLAHNHPGGDVLPTEHDKLLTRAIVLAAETVEIRVLDHLVLSTGASFSFRQAGLL